jgi:hypothetical protein
MKQSTAMATLPPERAARASGKAARSFDQRGVVAVAVPVKAISALASEAEHMFEVFVLPDDKDMHPILLSSLTPQKHFADAIAELEPVLTRAATTSEIQAMVCMLFDTLGQRADAGAKNRVGGYVLALMNHGLDDDPVISATTLGLAIARLLKIAKRPPLPSRLLTECISVREKVETLVNRLRFCGMEMAVVRKELEWEIEWRDFDFRGPDSEIPE